MPVPVSEISVTFSIPGFLLLGRQRAALPKPSPCLALLLAVLAPGGSSQPLCARSLGDVGYSVGFSAFLPIEVSVLLSGGHSLCRSVSHTGV